MNASLFCLLFMVVSCCAVSCSLPCECVRVGLRRCPTLSSCYSQRIKTWGEKKRITPLFSDAEQTCRAGLSAFHPYFTHTVHENSCWQWGCKWKGLGFSLNNTVAKFSCGEKTREVTLVVQNLLLEDQWVSTMRRQLPVGTFPHKDEFHLQAEAPFNLHSCVGWVFLLVFRLFFIFNKTCSRKSAILGPLRDR